MKYHKITFFSVHGRRRSKTGRKLRTGRRQKSDHKTEKHDKNDILWRETVSDHDKFDASAGTENSDSKHDDGSEDDKKCDHADDDTLWRETVSHQHFITTSPHPHIIPDTRESSTVTPLSDLSQGSLQIRSIGYKAPSNLI